MRKRRTREHVIADLSVNHVERVVLRCGWTVERKRHDYGIDLVMDTYTSDGEVQNGRILFQLKAADSLRRSGDGAFIPVRLEWRDLLYWLTEPLPVILIVYDAQMLRRIGPTGYTCKNTSGANDGRDAPVMRPR